jgi:hypothetical protein
MLNNSQRNQLRKGWESRRECLRLRYEAVSGYTTPKATRLYHRWTQAKNLINPYIIINHLSHYTSIEKMIEDIEFYLEQNKIGEGTFVSTSGFLNDEDRKYNKLYLGFVYVKNDMIYHEWSIYISDCVDSEYVDFNNLKNNIIPHNDLYQKFLKAHLKLVT